MPAQVDDQGRYRVNFMYDTARPGAGVDQAVLIEMAAGHASPATLQSLVAALRRGGVGPRYDGVFRIAEVAHAAGVRGWDPVKKETLVGRAKPTAGVAPRGMQRLAPSAPVAAREVQAALLAAGYARASFVLA